MSATHVPWGSIELLHNIVRTLRYLNHLPTVQYRAKVKLHGTNTAVQVTPNGVYAQSRTQMLTAGGEDYKGFAAWVKQHEAYFAARAYGVIFGEWCGPGIEKGMAISQVPTKMFVVFAVQHAESGMIQEPDEIRELLGEECPAELHVLPWEGEPVHVNFADTTNLELIATELDRRVVEVEREDPWVKATFGISGLGEGLVLYPVTKLAGPATGGTEETPAGVSLMFKAKGEKHRTVHAKSAVQVDATAVASIDAFVALVVTPARLAQIVTAIGGRDIKKTGQFMTLLANDVKKECVAELEAAGLTWEQVDKAVCASARTWFIRREAAE